MLRRTVHVVGSGIIFVVIVALWAVILVPMWLRSHDAATESKSVDRFSTAMRSLSRRGAAPGSRDVLMPGRSREVEISGGRAPSAAARRARAAQLQQMRRRRTIVLRARRPAGRAAPRRHRRVGVLGAPDDRARRCRRVRREPAHAGRPGRRAGASPSPGRRARRCVRPARVARARASPSECRAGVAGRRAAPRRRAASRPASGRRPRSCSRPTSPRRRPPRCRA